MKIGILSMQKVLNYGSFLQALSLKLQLEKRGHEVYFMDILPGRQIALTDGHSFEIKKKFDKFFFKRIENYFLIQKMKKIHISDYTKYLNTGKVIDNTALDMVIIGSDEVFNATSPSPWGFSTQLFGNIPDVPYIATYAASCGSTSYSSAKQYEIIAEIKDSLRNIRYLSVRDQNTFEFINQIDGRCPMINVDPVFLTDYDSYISEVKRKKPYVLVYAYGNRISDPDEISAIKNYARNNKLEILCVGMQQRWSDKTIPANAFELLSYVRNADSVITDTFHGTVFSIKYNKKFVTIIRDSNRNKLHDLLERFELTNRELNDHRKLSEIMENPIDYNYVNQIILKEQKRASDYLDNITGGVHNK